MRIIKFRGKSIESNKWVYGFFFIAQTLPSDYSVYRIREIAAPQNNHAVIPETVGQYTDINDRNGKEIYEGDIVECSHSIGQLEESFYTAKVLFDGGSFCIDTPDIDLLECAGEVEVIGNIYEPRET